MGPNFIIFPSPKYWLRVLYPGREPWSEQTIFPFSRGFSPIFVFQPSLHACHIHQKYEYTYSLCGSTNLVVIISPVIRNINNKHILRFPRRWTPYNGKTQIIITFLYNNSFVFFGAGVFGSRLPILEELISCFPYALSKQINSALLRYYQAREIIQ